MTVEAIPLTGLQGRSDPDLDFDRPTRAGNMSTSTAMQPPQLLHRTQGPTAPSPSSLWRLASSFFLFGLLNNSLYVVILTAALELLPKGVPTGVVAFANIFPALIAKAFWPYVLKGEVRYAKRIWSCSGISFVGMLVSLLLDR